MLSILLKPSFLANLFGALFVGLDALIFAPVRSSFFDVGFYLLSEPLGVDFEVPRQGSKFGGLLPYPRV